MTTSILLRPPPLSSPAPSPSPSPVSTPLPALQSDLTSSSSSSSSSTSSSYLDLNRTSSAQSTRRIRFAPLPEPNRDLLLDHDHLSDDEPQSDTKSATQSASPPNDLSLALAPSVSPDSTLSSVRSSLTIRQSPDVPSKNTSKSRLLRPFSFLRRADSPPSSGSPISHSASLPSSRNASLSSITRSSASLPNSPSFHSTKLPRISTDDIRSFGRISFFRPRSGSSNSTLPPRTSSPPPKRSDPSKSLHRSASTGSTPAVKPVDAKRDWGEGSPQSIAGSGSKKRRASSSALTPGAGGGRHASSVKMFPNDSSVRPSTAPHLSLAPPRKHVKMLNGRVYGAKRYAAQTLANPFANVRDDPEFVEWGYGGMGSVQASAGIANDMWKGLQRSERGGALLAGSSFGSSPTSAATTGSVTAGGGRGSGARATSPIARRKMSDNIPECGMGNVGGGGDGEDDGSGMTWVKKRRAEREAKARLEQEAKELERKTQEKRKSGDSMDASVYASTASTSTSLTACTSAASTDLTTPTTSPLASRSPSIADLKMTSSPSAEPRDLDASSPCTVTAEQSSKTSDVQPASTSKDEHVLTTVRLSPNISSSCHKLERVHLGPADTETTGSTNSSGDEDEQGHGFDEEQDDDEEQDLQDVGRKTALGAGVEKISRHIDVEAR